MIASKAKTKANIIRRHKNEFYKNTEQTTTDYVLLKHIWDELDEGNAESILGDIETVRTLHNSLDDKIQTYESNEEVFERDAQRQKFDYFPFIRALIKIAHKKGLVEDPAIKKEKEAANKKRKKAPAKSNSAKTTEKTSKKRKSTTAKSVESEDKPAKKRKRQTICHTQTRNEKAIIED